MSSIRVSSGTPSSGTGKLRPVHIRANPPPPGQWTLVRECNIEKRDRFTDWQQTLVAHLRQMQDQLMSYSDFIQVLDEEIEETKKQWMNRYTDCDNKDSDNTLQKST